MTWVRIPDEWWADPRALELSVAARDLFVRLLSYSAAQRTDGAIRRSAVPMLTADPDLLAELVAGEFLTTCEAGWAVVEPGRYLFLEAMRAVKADAGRKGNEARWGIARAMPDATADGIAKRSPYPSRPVPLPYPSPSSAIAQENDPGPVTCNGCGGPIDEDHPGASAKVGGRVESWHRKCPEIAS